VPPERRPHVTYRRLTSAGAHLFLHPSPWRENSLLVSRRSADGKGTCGVFRFDAETKAAIEKSIAELNATDPGKMDAETLKGLKTIVLPKEAKVIGVYQARANGAVASD
jgi:hypothetical protein